MSFAQTLHALRKSIQSDPETAITTLDDGIEKLYPYTKAYRSSYELYQGLDGTLLPRHDPTLIVRVVNRHS